MDPLGSHSRILKWMGINQHTRCNASVLQMLFVIKKIGRHLRTYHYPYSVLFPIMFPALEEQNFAVTYQIIIPIYILTNGCKAQVLGVITLKDAENALKYHLLL